jgi:hypothetical protein
MDINEIKQLINEVGYKYCSLWQSGNKIEPYNGFNMSCADKLDAIERRLKAFPSGLYQIKCKLASRSKEDTFDLDWINGKSNLSEQPIPVIDNMNPKLLENTTILNLSIENANLKKDVERLNDQVADLESIIADLEAQVTNNESLLQENAQPTLMENAKSFVETLMEYGVPLLNQHWELKKQQMEIERMKYGMRSQVKQSAPDPEKVQIRIIGEWVESKKGDPGIYEKLHEISAQSNSVKEFMQGVAQFNPELYAELSEQI